MQIAWAPGKGVKGKDLKDYWEVDLGVSYIPWSKLKPDIDLEMLEDGGMVDEDTMPTWLKIKVEQTAPKLLPPPQPPVMPNEASNDVTISTITPTSVTNIDTSQPPPLPAGGLLPQSALSLPIVSPFQLNNRLLGVGMNLPPGMMPNVPIGVPPPNMPPGAALMANQLLGIGSPFAQAPPNLLSQLSLSATDKMNKSVTDSLSASDSVLGFRYGVVPQPPPLSLTSTSHDDNNMDIEMEDAERTDKPSSIDAHDTSDRASNASNSRSGLGSFGNDRDIDFRQDRYPNKGMARGRDKERDNRDRRDFFPRGNNQDGSRDRESRRDRRDRTNRWGDREVQDHDDRRETEKSLNERLRDMAHQGSYSNLESSSDGPPSLLDRPVFPQFVNEDSSDRLELEIEHGENFRKLGPHDEFKPRMRRDDWIEERPEFDGPPRHHFNRDDKGQRPGYNHDDNGPPRPLLGRDLGVPHRPHLNHDELFIEEERFLRRDSRDDFIEEIKNTFDPLPMRGPVPGPNFGMGPPGLGIMGPAPRPGIPRHEFWGPPRPMRPAGPDAFHIRGRPPGPLKFLPRGPHIRGMRPVGKN